MADSFSNNLISNTVYHLLNFEKYSNFPAALYGAASNNNFQVVIFTKEFNVVVIAETRQGTTVAELINAFLKNDEQQEKSISVAGGRIFSYWRTIDLDGEKYHLALVDNDGSFSIDDLGKISEIIELSMRMWNFKPERDMAGEFVRAVRRGNRSLAYSLLDEMGIREDSLEVVFYFPGPVEEKGVEEVVSFETKYDLKVLKLSDQEGLAGVVLRPSKKVEFIDGEWQDLLQSICRSASSKAFYITGIDSVENTCRAFQEISETESYIQYIFPSRYSFSKYEIALASNVVSITAESGNIKRNYMDLIRPLMASQDAKCRNLIETLETFVLDAGLSTAQTARIMKIHANTVQYRLKKIREMLGVDITEPTRIPGLMIALSIARIERAVRIPNGD